MLSDVVKQALLEIAWRAVRAQVAGGPAVAPDGSMALPDASGVFVTLKRRGELRGCLGTLECRRLAEDVARCAADAASLDPRFPPVAVDELVDLSLEISVLGPLEPIHPPVLSAVVVGLHGLVVEEGARRGLLLPQVATERNWTPEQFLRQTCGKAGLPDDAWRHGATVYRFEAIVFGD